MVRASSWVDWSLAHFLLKSSEGALVVVTCIVEFRDPYGPVVTYWTRRKVQHQLELEVDSPLPLDATLPSSLEFHGGFVAFSPL